MSKKAEERGVDEGDAELTPGAVDDAGSGPGDAADVEALVRERDELRASWQRARADYQNLKRRTLSDIEAAVSRAEGALLEQMLLVLDYLDMALATECRTEEGRALHAGVELTRQELASFLDREGVAPIATDGAFDPTVHQAVATIETREVEPGHVIETVRGGWTRRGQVLRYAQVKVAAAPQPIGETPRGRPEPSEPDEPDERD